MVLDNTAVAQDPKHRETQVENSPFLSRNQMNQSNE